MKLCCAVFVLLALAATLLAGGCASTPDGPTETEVAKSARIDRESRMLGEELLNAFIDNSPRRFIALLPQDARKKFGDKEFAAAREALKSTLGEAQNFSYVTVLDAPVFKSYLWKVVFSRHATLKQEKEYSQETLFRVVVGTLDGKPYIVSFGFL